MSESDSNDTDQVEDAGLHKTESSGETIDLEKLSAALNSSVSFAKDNPKRDEQIEEIAEDMVHLMGWVKALQSRQEETLERLDRLQAQIFENTRVAATELDKLRRELVGDRKAMAVRSVFQSVLPSLDSLRAMRAALHPEQDRVVYAQISALISSLSTIIQGLGFVEYRAQTGDPYDPSRMECLGYEEGLPDQVLKVLRPGYLVSDVVVRPCGVLIAGPEDVSKEQKQEER